ncbi:PLD nuclease N-terminal domain-containing protein [Streptomyces sp. NPDC058052]|uniref:PLD nuclease N-terminal domain-containing protein n=1 Tax=Streptomyces sp. NPDC058052 TaxID=3346316 RepID=UPI0036EEC45B
MLRALMIILPLALTIYAFIDCLNTPEDEVKHLPKVVWVIIILLFWVVGPIVWLFAGKTRQPTARGARGGGGWVAPDDNPEFLKSLSDEKADEDRRRDDALFKDWEDDLKRREDELKRREDGGEEKDA